MGVGCRMAKRTKDNDGVSKISFANTVGCSESLIRRLTARGTIPMNPDKTIPLQAGIKAYEEHKRTARSGVGFNQVARRNPRPKDAEPKAKAKAKTTPKAKPKSEPIIEEAPAMDEVTTNDANYQDTIEKSASIANAMNKAKLAEKTYQAKLKEIEYRFKSGELLEKSAVEVEARNLAEKVKAALLAIPPRVSSMCEGRLARDIEDILLTAINDALKDLQRLE